MRLQELDTSRRFRAEVLTSRRITPARSPVEVRELELAVPSEMPGCDAGQSVGVLAPGDPELSQAEHLRLYTVADMPQTIDSDRVKLKLCVRRCDYVDRYSGERYQGRASHYLCDRHVGDAVVLTGPYGDIFRLPDDPQADLILIAAGTGIAPYRAFIRRIDDDHPDFQGTIHLIHGGRSRLDLLYQNEVLDDLSQYTSRDRFRATTAVAERPHWSENIDWDAALEPQAEPLRQALLAPHTYVYLAGLEPIRDEIDRVLGKTFGSIETWARRKAELIAGGRWHELLY